MRNYKLLKICSLEGKPPEKHVSDIIFVGRWLFMGVMSIRKYSVHRFHHQIVNNGCILTDNESEDKVVYLQKWQQVIIFKETKKQGNLRKGVYPSWSLFQVAVTVCHCFFCEVRS